jgi:hypothetical protein
MIADNQIKDLQRKAMFTNLEKMAVITIAICPSYSIHIVIGKLILRVNFMCKIQKFKIQLKNTLRISHYPNPCNKLVMTNLGVFSSMCFV